MRMIGDWMCFLKLGTLETAGETANPIFENTQVGLVLVWIMMSNMMTARFDQQ